MGRGTLHSPNQPSNHCTVRAQRRFERHGIKVEITLVRSGDAKDAARGDVFKMKQMLLGARLPKGSGSTQARVRTSAPEVLKGAGSNGVRAGSSGALAEVRLWPALPAWAVTIRGASPTPDDNLPVPTQTKVKPPEACAATVTIIIMKPQGGDEPCGRLGGTCSKPTRDPVNAFCVSESYG